MIYKIIYHGPLRDAKGTIIPGDLGVFLPRWKNGRWIDGFCFGDTGGFPNRKLMWNPGAQGGGQRVQWVRDAKNQVINIFNYIIASGSLTPCGFFGLEDGTQWGWFMPSDTRPMLARRKPSELQFQFISQAGVYPALYPVLNPKNSKEVLIFSLKNLTLHISVCAVQKIAEWNRHMQEAPLFEFNPNCGFSVMWDEISQHFIVCWVEIPNTVIMRTAKDAQNPKDWSDPIILWQDFKPEWFEDQLYGGFLNPMRSNNEEIRFIISLGDIDAKSKEKGGRYCCMDLGANRKHIFK